MGHHSASTSVGKSHKKISLVISLASHKANSFDILQRLSICNNNGCQYVTTVISKITFFSKKNNKRLSVWDHLFKKTLRNVKRRENIVRI
jgi:hypothetical protein